MNALSAPSRGLLRVVVPMKPAYEAKSRLAGALDTDARAALSLVLLEHVLRALAGATLLIETRVVGGDGWVRSVAANAGTEWAPDPGGGLNAVVRWAFESAWQDGAPAALVLPADLGLLDARDVDGIVARSRGLRSAVVAEATSDGGTNALLAGPGLPIEPSFGPRSFDRHILVAQQAGTPVELWSSPGVSFDLDTLEDLEAYRAARPDFGEALEAWLLRLRSPISAQRP